MKWIRSLVSHYRELKRIRYELWQTVTTLKEAVIEFRYCPPELNKLRDILTRIDANDQEHIRLGDLALSRFKILFDNFYRFTIGYAILLGCYFTVSSSVGVIFALGALIQAASFVMMLMVNIAFARAAKPQEAYLNEWKSFIQIELAAGAPRLIDLVLSEQVDHFTKMVAEVKLKQILADFASEPDEAYQDLLKEVQATATQNSVITEEARQCCFKAVLD